MDAFFFYPWLFPLFVTIFGLIIGSFLNVVIYRLPQMMTLAWKQDFAETFPEYEIPITDKPVTLSRPHSFCPHCHHPIRPWHNIPVISWLFLRGKCAYCQEKISARYPLIELVSATASCVIALHTGMTLYTAALLLFTFAVIAAAMIDLDTMLLPDSITLPLMWGGILLSLAGLSPMSLDSAVIGAIAGYLSLWSVYWIFKLLTKKEGMGYGDFKLFAALGAWMGWQMLPIIIFIASIIGIMFGVTFLLMKKDDINQGFPFGPSLAIAGWLCLIWGADILNWYSLILTGTGG
ncbi:prepilin peptidase [Vibrio quintilis]|uniref:Prepilin leader peptidase/N-methyltransferase n=1 Tax=Vibrio quintilis TaxID=1117707 RepID=A0A1M7YTW3_9VIBR|nr:A24 family peptidase [Vibrio quintilis]SHO56094.1 Type 4 prepilin-like proteins leader peptide-processing enzyme [Vibrio quintilis]